MYRLSVPFLLEQIDRYGADQYINKLKQIGADIVFLSIGCYQIDKAKQEKVFNSLNQNVPLFQAAGFTVGVWVWTFMIEDKNEYLHITDFKGRSSQKQVCPSDKEFCLFAYEYMRNIAKSNPDMIMFDDDFRYGFLDCGLGCTCKNHRATMEKILGEKLPEGDLSKLVFTGGENKYRSAFLRANGQYLKEFAKQSRAAVNSVNPEIRLGLCSCMSTWDFDGVTTVELARLLAGKTEPFCRLIGAPYWSSDRAWGNRLQDVIELERMESSWCEDDIEIFAEGDCYPRPRFSCPANVLEGFDMAMRASGATDGILKYTLDYYADVDYENGYNRKHLQNRKIYEEIDSSFGDKSPVGVRIYERMAKFETMDVPYYHDGKASVENMFFSPAAKLLAAQTIPSVYTGLGTAGIAFGENAKYLNEAALDNGMILDLSAAKILGKAGIDVGLKQTGAQYIPTQEYIPDQKRYIWINGKATHEMLVKDGAVIHSYFTDGEKRFVGSYSYENATGQKFLVFGFDGYNMSEHTFKQDARGEQIERWIASIGKSLPASMHGNPDCYLLCKENEAGKAVWIGNFFADECMNTTITLDKSYQKIKFINCNGTLHGNEVRLDSIAPYASVGFEVK